MTRAWLCRIVHYVAISNLRRPIHDTVNVDPGHGTGGADHEVERRLEVRDALAGSRLASLRELQRRVMLSTAVEGRSRDEIAAALGLTHGAVRGLPSHRHSAGSGGSSGGGTPTTMVTTTATSKTDASGQTGVMDGGSPAPGAYARAGSVSSMWSSNMTSPSSARWTGHLAAITRKRSICSSVQPLVSRNRRLNFVGHPRSAG